MIVVLGSVRGSPGVTSWSLLLATAWPVESGTERVVLEADAAGGVLGARYGWGVEPGLASLAAALRTERAQRRCRESTGAKSRRACSSCPHRKPQSGPARCCERAATSWQSGLRTTAACGSSMLVGSTIAPQTMGFVERAAATLLVSSGSPGGRGVAPITSRCRSGTASPHSSVSLSPGRASTGAANCSSSVASTTCGHRAPQTTSATLSPVC